MQPRCARDDKASGETGTWLQVHCTSGSHSLVQGFHLNEYVYVYMHIHFVILSVFVWICSSTASYCCSALAGGVSSLPEQSADGMGMKNGHTEVQGYTLSVYLHLADCMPVRHGHSRLTRIGDFMPSVCARLGPNSASPGEDTVPSRDVLTRAKIIPTYSLLKQRRLHWLGHVSHMEDGRVPKDSNMVGLAPGRRPRGRPRLGFKDLCK